MQQPFCGSERHRLGRGPVAGQVQPQSMCLQGHLPTNRFTDSACRPCWAYRCLERPSQALKPGATSVGLRAAQQEARGTPRPDAASSDLARLGETSETFAAGAKTSHLYGISHKLEEAGSQRISGQNDLCYPS